MTLYSVRRRLATCVAVGAVVCGTLAAALPAEASARPDNRPVTTGSRYLALGDSVPFGYRERTNTPPPNYFDAASFVGYPEDIGAELKVRTTNAACPGETSASLIDASAPSNGCETDAKGTGPGYRSLFALHVAYHGSQLKFAVHYLQRHRDTRLVSLMIGANDGFLCQTRTADHCLRELPAVLAKIKANVETILKTIRHTGYRGQLVLVNYYSLNYASAAADAQSQGLNQAIDAAGARYHVSIADGYGAFQRAAVQAGGDSCAAGLLTKLTTGGCGVHPSVAGQELLAGAVERVVRQR